MLRVSQREEASKLSVIEEAFTKAREKGEGALITYICAGDPTPKDTIKYIHALVKGGCDLIEIGLPFSDPIAEGPTIQGSIDRALNAGMNPDLYFDLVKGLDMDIPLLVMTYYNLIFKRGVDKFVSDCVNSNISGIIVPDLPIEESGDLAKSCKRHGIDLIYFIAPTTTDSRIKATINEATGFLYLLARLGVTGARADVPQSAEALLTRLKDVKISKAVGFGISRKEHAEALVRAGADGVIVGSAFVDIIAACEDTEDKLTNLVKELKDGCKSGFSQRQK
ncbi:MAG: tryptophan synthase subunit alpha [Halobacteriota archaeon]|nr:tryptophan synthase subunit alpha [Halobacteriota archaeon]